MKLKRLLTILLAIAALGSAAACNGDKDSEKSESVSEESTAETSAAGETTPIKYQLIGVSQDGIRTFFLFYNAECGMTKTEADVDIDDMIKVES